MSGPKEVAGEDPVLCLCGHQLGHHDEDNYHSFCEGSGDRDKPCDCMDFVPVLKWPDKPGAYWVFVCGASSRIPTYAFENADGVMKVWNPMCPGLDGAMTREEWDCFGGLELIWAGENPFMKARNLKEIGDVQKQAPADAGCGEAGVAD